MKRVLKFISLLFVVVIVACSIISVGAFADEYVATGDLTTPANVIKVTPDVLDNLIDHRADGKTEILDNSGKYVPIRETYNPQDRQWQGTPSVGCIGKRIWCAWQTGGSTEPRIFNYIAIAYSDDYGKTWVDPFLIVDHLTGEFDKGAYVTCPSFWVNANGNLCMNYVQYGTWTLEFNNADAEDINDVTWKEPYKMSNSRCAKAPVKVKDGDGKDWLMYASESEAGDSHPYVSRIYASENDGKTWKIRAVIPSSQTSNRTCAESNLVQTANGTLILASRIEDGNANGVEVSYSYDYGLTWTDFQANLKEPFIGPGSKFHLETLPSGNLLMVNHATTSSRENLKIYLSEDNGQTWPYQMTLDARADVTYPYVFVNGDKIYITWDKGRYIEKEIRLSILTETDIKAGKVVTENSATMLKVNKLNSTYKEIIVIKTPFDREITFEVGTESAKIREKLPTTITVVDDSGAEHVLNGVWKCKGYDSSLIGVQTFNFEADMPLNVADNYNLLQAEVTLTEKQTKGCSSQIGFNVSIIVPILAIACLTFLLKQKRNGES